MIDEGEAIVRAFPHGGTRLVAGPPPAHGSALEALQACVLSHTGVEAIDHGNRGQPLVPGYSVSISSTRGLTVLALARGVTVGVDCEYVRPMGTKAIMRYLTSVERAVVEEADEESAVTRAIRLWTRKEAWSKIDFRGIDASWSRTTITQTWLESAHGDPTPTGAGSVVMSLPGVYGSEVALAWQGSMRDVRYTVAPSSPNTASNTSRGEK